MSVTVPLSKPLLVVLGEVYLAVEGARPEQVRGVIVRVGDDDGADATQIVNLADGGVVEEGDAVPEDVALGRPDEGATLADADLGSGVNEGDTVIFVVSGEVVLILGPAI